MKANTPVERLYNGIIKENPTFVLMLGMCPTLAVTTSAMNGLGMGLTTMVILAMSNMIISHAEKGHSRWGADACLYCGGGFFCDHRSVPFAGLYSRRFINRWDCTYR